ncbi:heparinase II/III family protein [Phaeovulum vinaykumarii]|uniref:Uncharacterized conserved protein, heparinase superfamily n=1 Tax=Phaeovulum vinaykumarii TaxID=407234 RepID=A0A1N7KYZ9_9RHOB|nr:heparinase II/III family protein [Phaeovulum vinaykumarii]SIS66630.1 Uncharacterized conserved protein, heparinase superfamily [Phaeovulum vinaykumarii]SOC01022.1 uncharacterized heparinase superfamily protein [Phaeovulum vinaykumarii]
MSAGGQDSISGPGFADRWAARRAARARPVSGFALPPEPRSFGLQARGRQLVAGHFLFAGSLVEAPETSIWDLPLPDPAFEAALHGAAWLDDLAALGDGPARARAQEWSLDWAARFGRGKGPGWTPELTGRRLIRMVSHAGMVLAGAERARADAFFAALGAQTLFLVRRWRTATPGLARFEALTGLVCAALALAGMERHVGPAAQDLAEECRRAVDREGGIPTRNPEDLLEVFTLLVWTAEALGAAGRRVEPAHRAAIERIAPALRALRHADGGLARFHGGGRGVEGRLDQALAASGVRAKMHKGLAMGFARLSAGRASVIMDCAAPPAGPAARTAHASTLAFEMTSGRRPLIVSCGSGLHFGRDWHRAGRATPSHSTLCVAGYSSSRLGPAGAHGDELCDRPHSVWSESATEDAAFCLRAGHDGYVPTHGLTHLRELRLSVDGRHLAGTDTLGAMSGPDTRRFETILARSGYMGVDFSLHFHIHPDIEASLDLGGTAVSLALRSGEIWIFRTDPGQPIRLAPSVYLEKGRLKPRPARQIVLDAHLAEPARAISWTLTKAHDTSPAAIADDPLPRI